MKLFNANLEKSIIRALTEDSKAGTVLLSSVKPEHFNTEVAQVAYKRISKLVGKRGMVPNWHQLCTDPSLPDFAKSSLGAFAKDYPKTTAEATIALDSLNKYLKMRKLNEIGVYLSQQLGAEACDPDELSLTLESRVSDLDNENDFRILRLGLDSNARKTVEELLKTQHNRYIPTGFAAHDDQNKGIPRSSALLIGAPTGGGKSLMLNQLAINAAKRGYKAALVTLEMSNEETMQRTLSQIGHVDMLSFLDPEARMTLEVREKVKLRAKKLSDKIAKAGGQLLYVEPTGNVNLLRILTALKPYKLDEILIDYIGLLDFDSHDDQWKQLGDATKLAKRWANTHRQVIGLAAQVTDEGMIRYSQAIKEHASNAWVWKRRDPTGDSEMIIIDQIKARNQKKFPFSVLMHQSRMTVRDLTEQEAADLQAQIKKPPEEKQYGKKKDEEY